MRKLNLLLTLVAIACARESWAAELKAGDPAPLFTAKTNRGETFDLSSRKGQWTVLYFYPKAGTPGCTAQAQGFRDHMAAIRAEGAEVFGVSTDTVESQESFHDDQHLDFTLIADPDGKVSSAYGAKMPVLTYAKRWTFIIDPELKIREIDREVDAAQDAERVAKAIASLKKAPAQP